jgi:hypothetical protein
VIQREEMEGRKWDQSQGVQSQGVQRKKGRGAKTWVPRLFFHKRLEESLT